MVPAGSVDKSNHFIVVLPRTPLASWNHEARSGVLALNPDLIDEVASFDHHRMCV
jgi:hypothetical protein